MDSFKVEGLVTAPFTPFKGNGDINFEMFQSYADYLVSMEISAVFVNGSTGEGLSLTVEERKQTLEAWVKAVKNRMTIIAHVGALNIKDCQALSQHAQAAGADAIASMASLYYKPATEEDLVAYMKEVAAAAPKLPFYYYDIDFMTGVNLNNAKFLRLAAPAIPTLKGAKVSSRSLQGIADCLTEIQGTKMQIMMGSDEQFLAGLAFGVDIPIMNSFVAPMFHRMIKAFKKGDMDAAKKEQYRCLQVSKIKAKYGGGFAASKAVMNVSSGLDMGPPRLPLKSYSKETTEKIKNELTEAGYFYWMKETWK
ncbi:N-acetylneuraminate lyase isoform X1 [Lingula anatina]|uniref:N-acetylneuraminate lyase n=1 Tax=Lingula anatina TaxID=7574 RepID=A0A1S3HIS4_LINAN|nr:N-acetylneuraminate lyase isoform X1 [Lingula anatina]|eukprot:XP_013386008.1 N-acetylneuraminate lyase isoform X1 [Lingula anatina]